jgi:crossover junction endodeoxyribonuclease RuvC
MKYSTRVTSRKTRLLGLDPGLRRTGWGVIDVDGSRLIHIGNGVICSTSRLQLTERLVELHTGVIALVNKFQPDEVAAEETFVNKNPESTLKLGIARGAVLLAPALSGISVTEYAPNRVKKSVVGAGHANKDQVQIMVSKILPKAVLANEDAADALAVAICHAHYAQNRHLIEEINNKDVPKNKRYSNNLRMKSLIDAALLKDANR